MIVLDNFFHQNLLFLFMVRKENYSHFEIHILCMSKNKQKTRYFHFGIYIDRNWKKKKKKVKLRMRNLFGFHKFKRSHLLSNTFFVKLWCYSRRGKQFNSKRKFRILKSHILRACACMVCCKSFQILLWNYRSALKPSFVALRE